jgi:hypothetical protein
MEGAREGVLTDLAICVQPMGGFEDLVNGQ